MINRLANAGATPNLVLIIWFKEANVANSAPVMEYYDSLVFQTVGKLKEKIKLRLICYEIRNFMILLRFDIRGVAQLVAYLVWDQRVVSSSLATPTIIKT